MQSVNNATEANYSHSWLHRRRGSILKLDIEVVGLYLGYPHCGPFNEVSDQPSSGLDEVCRQHDLEYGKLGSVAYFRNNEADAKFREQAADINGPAARLTSGIWAVKQRLTHLNSNNNKEMRKQPTGRYLKLAKEAGISDSQRHAAYSRINAAKRRKLDQQAVQQQVSDDDIEDAVGPMDTTDGGMITSRTGAGGFSGGLGGNSSTNVTMPGYLMPMPLRRGYGVKRYYKRGVMIFCNGGPITESPPRSASDGNIDKIFSWQPWHSRQIVIIGTTTFVLNLNWVQSCPVCKLDVSNP